MTEKRDRKFTGGDIAWAAVRGTLSAFGVGGQAIAQIVGELVGCPSDRRRDELLERIARASEWSPLDYRGHRVRYGDAVAIRSKATGAFVMAHMEKLQTLGAWSEGIGAWETFWILSPDPSVVEARAEIDAGDAVLLLASSGLFVMAEQTSGGEVENQLQAWVKEPQAWERFTLASRSPHIHFGDVVALQDSRGRYVQCSVDGDHKLLAIGRDVGEREQFVLHPVA